MSFYDQLMHILKDVLVEVGPHHYKEPFHHDTFLKMPANALVNIGYVVMGFFWFRRILGDNTLNSCNYKYMFYVFATLGTVYAPIQFMRIITQDRFWGIMDQWITLPFFMLVSTWNVVTWFDANGTYQQNKNIIHLMEIFFVIVSIMSYFLATLHPLGFDALVGIHIIGAVFSSVLPLKMYKHESTVMQAFYFTILSCAGFVVLKLLDHEIPLVFDRFSGHFWSKICDFLQVHFTLQFFYSIHKLKYSKVK